jgi:hypothetical protein
LDFASVVEQDAEAGRVIDDVHQDGLPLAARRVKKPTGVAARRR